MPYPASSNASPLALPVALAALLLMALLPLAACKDGGLKPRLEDANFSRRVFRPPPTDEVRAVPPHNIHGTGVGPYELSASFQKTLALLPNGPRVERFESEALFDYRLMRTDNDALLLGVGRRNLVAFISVLDPDIARTESGIGVGVGVKELIGALGAVRVPEGTGRDPRVVTFTALPDTRFIVEASTVVAAVVMGPSERPRQPEQVDGADEGPDEVADSSCGSQALRERRAEILRVADFGSDPASMMWTCLNDDSGEVVVRSKERLKIIDSSGPDAPLRVVAKGRVPGLDFVAALKTGGERAELYAVTTKQDASAREVVVSRMKVGGGRILPVWNRSAFKLKASAASWLGTTLEDTDFLVELRGRDRLVQVGGIFVQRSGGKLRNVVPLNTVELVDGREGRKTPVDPEAAGEGAQAADAGPTKSSPTPAP